jgi:hypothetical protein
MDFVAVNNFGDTREGGLAGPMGLFIIVLMSIATVLLIRNMNKRLRRLPDSFDKVDDPKRAGGVTETTSSAAAADTVVKPTAVEGDRSKSGTSSADPQVIDVDATDRPAAKE